MVTVGDTTVFVGLRVAVGGTLVKVGMAEGTWDGDGRGVSVGVDVLLGGGEV